MVAAGLSGQFHGLFMFVCFFFRLKVSVKVLRK